MDYPSRSLTTPNRADNPYHAKPFRQTAPHRSRGYSESSRAMQTTHALPSRPAKSSRSGPVHTDDPGSANPKQWTIQAEPDHAFRHAPPYLVAADMPNRSLPSRQAGPVRSKPCRRATPTRADPIRQTYPVQSFPADLPYHATPIPADKPVRTMPLFPTIQTQRSHADIPDLAQTNHTTPHRRTLPNRTWPAHFYKGVVYDQTHVDLFHSQHPYAR